MVTRKRQKYQSREGPLVNISEEDLRREIEALRCQLNEKVGDRYNRAKIQAAGTDSARLDDLIYKWLSLHYQAEKRDSR